MLPGSPFIICRMVFAVLKHGKYEGPELGDKEFGYQDRIKNEWYLACDLLVMPADADPGPEKNNIVMYL